MKYYSSLQSRMSSRDGPTNGPTNTATRLKTLHFYQPGFNFSYLGLVSTRDNRVLNGPLGRSLGSFARTAHFTHQLRSALLRYAGCAHSLHSRERSLTQFTPSWGTASRNKPQVEKNGQDSWLDERCFLMHQLQIKDKNKTRSLDLSCVRRQFQKNQADRQTNRQTQTFKRPLNQLLT